MNHFRKITALCTLALALCLTVSGCNSGPKQTAAKSAEEATLHFLTDLQNGEFDMAKTYLAEGNPLLYVFPAGEGEDAPALSAVYQQFCEKMKGITFRVGDEGAVGNSMVYIAARQYDFRTAINDAMLEAIQNQCQNGGDAFSNYAAWMEQGIANAEMGGEETVRAMATEKKGAYEIDHRGYTDHDFMNLITGGFYDYADFQMAVCTGSMDDVGHTYYIAALGDEVIACIEEVSVAGTEGELDDETIAALNTLYAQSVEQTPGIYMGVYKSGDRVVTCAGIDFQTADQRALVNSGMVSGAYQGNMADGHLSLASTIRSFEKNGMTCEVTPIYGAEK
ncbi:MAG: hypothetical protein K2M15_08025 [Oscillospiraceae bacterium]|nr:hypothetical protein [Oscillospiraceae bacterium]MDE7171836.1 hypothetical protein [Oscillospiraceae bacterium]